MYAASESNALWDRGIFKSVYQNDMIDKHVPNNWILTNYISSFSFLRTDNEIIHSDLDSEPVDWLMRVKKNENKYM